MPYKTLTLSIEGITSSIVEVQTEILKGLRRFSIVGLPDGVVKEAKDRVRCALENSGFEFPNAEIVVSLAPATLRKVGSSFDLAIALSILRAMGEIPEKACYNTLFAAELSLDGSLSALGSELAILNVKDSDRYRIFVASESEDILQHFYSDNLIFASSLSEVLACLKGVRTIGKRERISLKDIEEDVSLPDYSDVIGHESVIRALQISAAGGHNLLMLGPPGGGKSMLARRLPSLLPKLNNKECLEVNTIHSVGSVSRGELILTPPFRSPHHTLSAPALVGGGAKIAPGEVTLAHRGVLFLDEFAELRRDVMQALREPLEEGHVSVSRARTKAIMPAEFILIAAMNPCPCGKSGSYESDSKYVRSCSCSEFDRRKYVSKISGPILDRFDIQVWVKVISPSSLLQERKNRDVGHLKVQVKSARLLQLDRNQGRLNSSMSSQELMSKSKYTPDSLSLLEDAVRTFKLSTRACTRIMRISRTIADLDSSNGVNELHMSEAIGLRVQLAQI